MNYLFLFLFIGYLFVCFIVLNIIMFKSFQKEVWAKSMLNPLVFIGTFIISPYFLIKLLWRLLKK